MSFTITNEYYHIYLFIIRLAYLWTCKAGDTC